MQKYVLYLTSQSEKVQAHHLCNTSKDTESSATLITLPAKNEPILECYKELYQRLATLPLYEPLFLYDIAPANRYDRRQWLSELQLPFPVTLYRYAYGNHLGAAVFAWKLPSDASVDQTEVSRIFSKLTDSQAFYSTRAMHHDFLEKYCHLANGAVQFLSYST